MSPRRTLSPTAWAMMLLAGLSVFAFRSALFAGRVIILRDLAGQFHPWQEFERRCFARGEWPLWCPHNDAGLPLLASLQPAVLYPFNAAFRIWRFSSGLALFAALHLFLAGAFMFALLRSMRAGRLPALAAGVAYMLSGWMLVRLEFLSSFAAAAYAPLILLAARRTWLSTALRWPLLWAAAAAWQVLAGHPDTAILTAFMTGLWLAFHLVRRALAGEAGDILPALARCLLAASVGAALCAVQALPTLELAPLSNRWSGLTFSQAASRSVFPTHWLALLLPHAFGGVGYYRYWGGTLYEFEAGCSYVGVAALVLAAWAAAALLRRRDDARSSRAEVLCWLLIAGVGAALAMGRFLPLYPFLFHHVRPLAMGRWPCKFLLLPVFSLCVLAGLGAERLLRRPVRNLRALAAVWLAFNLAFGFVAVCWSADWLGLRHAVRRLLLLYAFDYQRPLYELWGHLVVQDALRLWLWGNLLAAALALLRLKPKLGAAGLAGLIAADLLAFDSGLHWSARENVYDRQTPNLEALRREPGPFRVYVAEAALRLNTFLYGARNPASFLWAKDMLLSNRNAGWGIDAVHSDNSIHPARMDKIRDALDSSDVSPLAKTKLLSLLNVRYLFDAPLVKPSNLLRIRRYRACEHAVRARLLHPRAFVAPCARVASDAEALAALRSDRFEPHQTALLPPEAASEIKSEAPPLSSLPRGLPQRIAAVLRRSPVRFVRLAAHETVLDTRTPGGWLVISRQHYPGWCAYDNGRRRRLWRADYAFCSVRLERGRRRIRLVYAPRSFQYGFAATVLALAIIISLSVARTRFGPRRSAGAGMEKLPR